MELLAQAASFTFEGKKCECRLAGMPARHWSYLSIYGSTSIDLTCISFCQACKGEWKGANMAHCIALGKARSHCMSAWRPIPVGTTLHSGATQLCKRTWPPRSNNGMP